MLRVGNRGDVGTVELQDLILTTKGGTAGVGADGVERQGSKPWRRRVVG
jgi:hypothetical protein